MLKIIPFNIYILTKILTFSWSEMPIVSGIEQFLDCINTLHADEVISHNTFISAHTSLIYRHNLCKKQVVTNATLERSATSRWLRSKQC